ncbi:MAG: SUMF1/EgtB/PvdO family nonheme iron enzyme [Planctomycetaceae bacterium]|jgi:formylglycine-generating enzyme required for sulfatase activity|nr:SUMF1/EgtB/PvdO family nonheme iron enzyme [Planctomycetaceae bacterium]
MKFRFSPFLFLAVFPAVLYAQTPEPVVEENTAWYDVSRWSLEGKGWKETSGHFTRMPKHAEAAVPKYVWNLSQHSAGLIAHFKTDAPTISVRHEVGGNLTMPHMTTVGSSGLDLYGKDDRGVWRWAGISKPNAPKYEYVMLKEAPAQLREYRIYLPLYNSTNALSIGVPKDCTFEILPPSAEKPVFWYGTSIVHGCSGSRPGMTVPAMLGRRLQVPVINFGFSGSGRMEIEMAHLIAEADASVYVLDCMPNMTAAPIWERAEAFIRELRRAKPDTPIIMVEGPAYSFVWIQPQWQKNQQEKCKLYRATFEKLRGEGMKGLVYVKGGELYGSDGDGTVDGSHPSDLGMFRNADVLEPVLREVITGNLLLICAAGSEGEEITKRDTELKAGDLLELTIKKVKFRFRWCPAGTFTMGSSTAENGRVKDEKPHQVTLTRGFWMLETEVTQEQWEAVAGKNPSHFKGAKLPVESVSWNDCQLFVEGLSKLAAVQSPQGYKFSLPTETQWEYACRAGTTGAYAGDLDQMAWYRENSGSKTREVGTKQANAWGLYDMHGNVWEWCNDWYGDYPTDKVTAPVGALSGCGRVIRGGCWFYGSRYCRAARRCIYAPDYTLHFLGVRVSLVNWR